MQASGSEKGAQNIFKLKFLPSALKEFEKLDPPTRAMLKKKLVARLAAPRVPSAALRGGPNTYKIKLRDRGLRLVYQVDDSAVTVVVVAVGKRDHGDVYAAASSRVPRK